RDARMTLNGRKRLALVRDLLTTRQREIVPQLADAKFGAAQCEQGILTANWVLAHGKTLRMLANLADIGAELPRSFRPLRPISTATTDLGRRSAGKAAAVVGVLEHRRGMMPPSVPLATYRLQLTPNFGFDQAAALVPYLKALGISHLYASPFLKARSGSPHGYD